MTAPIRSAVDALTLAAFLSLAAGAQGLAQPVQTAPAIADTLVAAIPVRLPDDVMKDTERASSLRSQTKQRLARAEEEVNALAGMINARKKDFEALEGYLDTLDSGTKAKEIATLKAKAELLEKIIDLLQLRKKMKQGDEESASTTIAYTEAQEEWLSFEGTLIKKRNDRTEIAKKSGSAADLAALDLVIKEMEGQGIKRWKKALDKHEDAVSKEQDYLDLIKKFAEAQEAFHAP
jgi:hypothetical protein